MSIDLKDMAREHEDLKTRTEDADPTLDDDDRERLETLQTLAKDLGDDLDDADRNGYCFIEEKDFEDYARDLAQDCSAIGRGSFDSWPMTCIDWAKAADDLRVDYNTVHFEGVKYLYLDP